jgi:ribosome-associated protein
MDTDSSVVINPDLAIPTAELSYRTSRSGGPGGQHVNTSSTRVELVWDVANSPSLTEEQRGLILERMASRLTADGVLILASSATRSQHRNREDVTERFAKLLRQALQVPKPRKKTRPSQAEREKRLEEKKRRSEIKKQRSENFDF